MPLAAGRNILVNVSFFCGSGLEAATLSDILYLFSQGNFSFIRQKSGNFQNRCFFCLVKLLFRGFPQYDKNFIHDLNFRDLSLFSLATFVYHFRAIMFPRK